MVHIDGPQEQPEPADEPRPSRLESVVDVLWLLMTAIGVALLVGASLDI